MTQNMPGEAENRAAHAFYLAYVEQLTQREIAAELGVTQQMVSKYLNNSEPSEKAAEEMRQEAVNAWMLTVATLKRQLPKVIERANGAVELTEDYGDADDLDIAVETDDGQVVDRWPVPKDFEYEPDHEARAKARAEALDILETWRRVTGASDFDIKISTDAETTGVDITTSVYAEDGTEEE